MNISEGNDVRNCIIVAVQWIVLLLISYYRIDYDYMNVIKK
ncbi:hypothetical protein Fsol_00137 [Candidatus Fokinia solitaria]|uniref:Uncharacterized protein n=1 Tax=Candidatus Fokinia solitaria TaxID=1802984 RepID=A0A2U8BRH8_9RICK|nr:hypothetical protein Fsol_00137 [Candidatus Fokinia solitaria]